MLVNSLSGEQKGQRALAQMQSQNFLVGLKLARKATSLLLNNAVVPVVSELRLQSRILSC